jgi:ribose-phosphate pyrophosphokinase
MTSPQQIPIARAGSSTDERLFTYLNAAAATSPPTNYTEVNSLLKHRRNPSATPTHPAIPQSVIDTHTHAHSAESSPGYGVRIIAGNGNRPLAGKIADMLDMKLEDCHVSSFADGEIDIHIKNNVRGADVYVIQPVSPPTVNKHLMELLLLIHTLKLSSAKRVTVVVPYYPYSRQDRKTKPRVPISASVVAQLIEAMGPHRMVTVDLHCGQIQGFFHKTPVDNLYAEAEMLKYITEKNIPPEELVIVSPDAGGVTRARRAADFIGAHGVVTIMKRRTHANQVDSMQMVGDVSGCVCLLIDDMIDTAGTLTKAAALLKENGATKVYAFATHGLFSDPALDRINKSVLEEVCVTDSLPQEKNLARCPKLKVLSIVSLLVEVIQRLHNEKSLSSLFPDTPLNHPQTD